MSAASNILKNFNLFVNGGSFAGTIDELQLPTLELQVEDYRAGGMDAPVSLDMGQTKPVCTFTLSRHDPDVLALWGLPEGNDAQLEARGAVESLDGTVSAIVVTMSGLVRSVEPEAWKAGQKAGNKFTVDCRFYRYEQDGETRTEIDIVNMVRLIDGVDRLEEIRAAIGI